MVKRAHYGEQTGGGQTVGVGAGRSVISDIPRVGADAAACRDSVSCFSRR